MCVCVVSRRTVCTRRSAARHTGRPRLRIAATARAVIASFARIVGHTHAPITVCVLAALAPLAPAKNASHGVVKIGGAVGFFYAAASMSHPWLGRHLAVSEERFASLVVCVGAAAG